MTAGLLLGLGAAVGYGLGDFLSGHYSRRLGIMPVLTVAQVAGLVALLVVAAPVSPPPTAAADLLWGAVAGILGVAGGVLLLYGFRHGRLSVVSPVSSVGAAGVPVLADLLVGNRPSTSALVGVVVGLVAIYLVSLAAEDPTRRRTAPAAGVWPGLGSGIGFGGLYLALDRADPGSGAWPVIAAQLAIVGAVGAVVLLRRQRISIPWRSVPGVAAAGVATAVATASFVYAARTGFVSIAAVLASLSPAVTVLLARWLLREALRAHQLVGLVGAGVALVLIGIG